MEDNFTAWRAVLFEWGVDLKPEDYYLLEGLSVYELPKRFGEKYHLQIPDPGELIRKKEKYYLENHHFTLYPGAEELIQLLRSRKVPIAVVTAALLSRLIHSTPRGFIEKFSVVVTGEDTKEGKPSPAPYLRGAEKLRFRPEDCIAVENAPLGIESAKKAGAYCVAVCSTLDKRYLEKADEVFDSLEDLKECGKIKELLNPCLGSGVK